MHCIFFKFIFKIRLYKETRLPITLSLNCPFMSYRNLVIWLHFQFSVLGQYPSSQHETDPKQIHHKPRLWTRKSESSIHSLWGLVQMGQGYGCLWQVNGVHYTTLYYSYFACPYRKKTHTHKFHELVVFYNHQNLRISNGYLPGNVFSLNPQSCEGCRTQERTAEEGWGGAGCGHVSPGEEASLPAWSPGQAGQTPGNPRKQQEEEGRPGDPGGPLLQEAGESWAADQWTRGWEGQMESERQRAWYQVQQPDRRHPDLFWNCGLSGCLHFSIPTGRFEIW